MYDEYSKHLIDMIPEIIDLNRTECRRALSRAFLFVIRSRIGITQNKEDNEDLQNTTDILRRLVDSMESISVFDPPQGKENNYDVENACAFVAAEASALLCEINGQKYSSDDDPIKNYTFYSSIESALLYMISGYDIDAFSVVKDLVITEMTFEGLDEISCSLSNNASYLANRIISLCRGNTRQPRSLPKHLNLPVIRKIDDYDSLIKEIRSNFYLNIGKSIDIYLDWLGGYDNGGCESAISSLKSLQQVSISKKYPNYLIFSDIYHLCGLLITTITRTSKRSLINYVPKPTTTNKEFLAQYDNYLLFRARGNNDNGGRPFLWPSSVEYIKNCMPGPFSDAVVSMPTGSGKGFIAELAITHALCTGWILYLAPTNALAHQIRHDLSHSLASFTNITIRAFVGSEEYTTLSEEQVLFTENNFVAVMTPEKCSLALRLYPEQFENCSLCVFDECHLLNDQHRGIIADVLISQLCLIVPSIRFLLMSAMVSNPDELADWLSSAHPLNFPSKPLSIKWRPSRTLRGLLVVDKESYHENKKEAEKILSTLPQHRVNQSFSTSLALVSGLSGPWTMDGFPDYRITSLPIKYLAKVSKKPSEEIFKGWKNTASLLLSEMLASHGIPTLCFILTSKHHTFSCAEKVTCELPEKNILREGFPKIVEAWLSIADAEFGIETLLRSLLLKGIAVHSSAMLSTERLASEWMFSSKEAILMFATGTLAQGLNLPAVAVVIAGTSMGDPRLDSSENNNRVNSMILNGFGRAGRPGFANQGMAVLVSDDPYAAKIDKTLDPTQVLNKYSVLGESDAAIFVQSPLEIFIDDVFSGKLLQNEVSIEELTLTSLLAEYDDERFNSGEILFNSFGGYKKRGLFSKSKVEQVRNTINQIRKNFLQQENTPNWINKVAMKSGVDFFRALKIWQSYNILEKNINNNQDSFTVINWVDLFFDVLSQLPPKQIIELLPDPSIKRNTVLTRMRRLILGREYENSIPWDLPLNWKDLWCELKEIVIQYMSGASYITIARKLLNLSPEEVTNKRTEGDAPIPMVFNLLSNVIDQLAIDAGCFSAIVEYITIQKNGKGSITPEALQALPLCIRNGCNSLGSLAWFRFGYRERICAHALEATFPVPLEIENDSDRSKWVHRVRNMWLADDNNYQTHPLLPAIKIAIIESDS